MVQGGYEQRGTATRDRKSAAPLVTMMEKFPAQRRSILYLSACIITQNRLLILLIDKTCFSFLHDPPKNKEEEPRAKEERVAERVLMICWAPSQVFLHPPIRTTLSPPPPRAC